MQFKKVFLGFGALLVLLSLFSACHRKTVSNDDVEDVVVGDDRDSHGCIGSAGYSWSSLMKECIRPWEKGISMQDVQHVDATMMAVLISGKEDSQKEVFLPSSAAGIVLTKKGKVWTDREASYTLREPMLGQFELYDSEGVLLYKTI